MILTVASHLRPTRPNLQRHPHLMPRPKAPPRLLLLHRPLPSKSLVPPNRLGPLSTRKRRLQSLFPTSLHHCLPLKHSLTYSRNVSVRTRTHACSRYCHQTRIREQNLHRKSQRRLEVWRNSRRNTSSVETTCSPSTRSLPRIWG